jgi:hypothetical protein
MKPLLASIVTALVLVAGAAAGVPNEIADLIVRVTTTEQTNDEQDARIAKLERKVNRLRNKNAAPTTVCRVVAGQPIPTICR